MLKRHQTVLVVIDIQDRLLETMYEKDRLIIQCEKLIKGCLILGIPIIWLEQYPEGIGSTTPSIARLFQHEVPISKTCFSAARSEQFNEKMHRYCPKNVILCGIETHVCVYQTAMDLRDRDYYVEVVRDAVSSRSLFNIQAGLQKMEHTGINMTTVEMLLFELLENAEKPEFRKILKLIK
ncbi:hydrolase [bacterium]|nr:hydrolase [candidate division CSSED10-310 bacterium]